MRSCFLSPVHPAPGGRGRAYFFHGDKYAYIEFEPFKNVEQIIQGPASVAHDWKALAKAGFATVDAVLPVPGNDNQAYFFSGDEYVRIEFVPGKTETKLIRSRTKIAEQWEALTKAGFTTVDAVLPVPGKDRQAYFFSGNEYVRIEFVPGKTETKLIRKPTPIAKEWEALAKAGITTVDAVLPVPGNDKQAYFFSGSQYARIEFEPGKTETKKAFGPANVLDYWKTLAWGW